MSPKSKVTPVVLEENDSVIEKPVKDIKVMKEKAKIIEQSAVDDYNEEELEISPQKYITVISLCPNQLNLSTLPGGKGKTFTFNSFGESKRIMYMHLIDVVDASPRFLNEGYYYIADKKVIRRHGLDDIYSKLLTKQMIESIFTLSMTEQEVAALYKSANKSQQSIIVDMIVQKLIADENSVDMNIVAAISKISGVNISEQLEDNKFYSKKVEA